MHAGDLSGRFKGVVQTTENKWLTCGCDFDCVPFGRKARREFPTSSPLAQFKARVYRWLRLDWALFLRMVAESQCETVSRGRLKPYLSQIFGFGAGSSRATTVSEKPLVLCEPSQNGLFAECPQRQRPMAVLPARPNAWPCGSTISKSPSILIEPLLLTVILVAGICSPVIGHSDFISLRLPRFTSYTNPRTSICFGKNGSRRTRTTCSRTF
jgi:hypothetical protein